MKFQPFSPQPLTTREDVENDFNAILSAAWSLHNGEETGILSGDVIPLYGKETAAMETFSRLLWGVFSQLACPESRLTDPALFFRVIANGTHPQHANYWGEPGDFDQRCVEMAVYGAGLALAGEQFKAHLSADEFAHLVCWLRKIHHVKLPLNNWSFFPIMVETGLCLVGETWQPDIIAHHFELLDSYYLGDGWYSDGKGRPRDYYNAMALHFYGLVYARLMADHDPQRCQILRDRATLFARDFIHMFAEDGSAIPFGRSLTYRFAQSAFWSAVAFAELPVFPTGVIKGLVLRNLNWWRQQGYLDPRGIMNVGYTYDNPGIAEDYNAPGSSYWACKSYLILALSEQSNFWQSKACELPATSPLRTYSHAGQIVHYDAYNQHRYLLNAGQLPAKNYNNSESKYAKFAYSSLLGFNLERSRYGIEMNACDSMLLFSEQDGYFRGRRTNLHEEISDSGIHCYWQPLNGITVHSWLVPLKTGHFRLHLINTNRIIDTVEGGFPIPVLTTAIGSPGQKTHCIINQQENLFSWIKDISPEIPRKSEVVISPPASNIIYPCSSGIVTLQRTLEPGQHLFACLVQAGRGMPAEINTTFTFNPQHPYFTITDEGISRNISLMFISER
ncbi:DUF2264 domain-containing protein [Kluyvera intermedia]|uniref:DUF2264 domain-containing protein n=1 Tax=Kluyvera intermedia TaxID=61648 RepID=UPI001F161490|nr:DUF2264 domain-containing protein [Kluyvera intermedia]MCE9889832.1 DUF2264 domain-containing protein [Kluyvera intermedia]